MHEPLPTPHSVCCHLYNGANAWVIHVSSCGDWGGNLKYISVKHFFHHDQAHDTPSEADDNVIADVPFLCLQYIDNLCLLCLHSALT